MDVSNCVIDVSSRCDLSLAARDTVEPAVEKLTDKFQVDLSLVARETVEPAIENSQKNIVLNLICMICMFLNPLERMSDTTDSTTGADGCDQLPESLKFACTELEPRPRVFTLRRLFLSRVALYTVSYRVPRVYLAR